MAPTRLTMRFPESSLSRIHVQIRSLYGAIYDSMMDGKVVPSTQHLWNARRAAETDTPEATSTLSGIIPNPISNHTNPDYSTGLAGVNITMDRRLIGWLGISIVMVILIVFAFRVWQLFSAHIRHVHCLHADKSQQAYWTFDKSSWVSWLKREIIYAPLGKKRHNREWQLSSAVNYGTLPGRIHTVLLLLFVWSNFFYCSFLPYHRVEKAALIAELRGRSGVLAVVNMIPLILMAGRNNPGISLLKISFDTYNLFHRWIGRVVLFESVVHVLAWYSNYSARHGASQTSKSFSGNVFLTSGLVAVMAMAAILIQSLSAVRHAFYETFLHTHQILAFTIFLGVYVHLDVEKLPALPYIKIVVIAWFTERCIRLFRVVYLNIRFRRRQMTNVLVEALPGEACRVTYQIPRHVTIRPGSHVYAYLPQISLWMSHPFSVAWTNVESEPATGPAPLYDMDDKASELTDLKSPNSLERQCTRPSIVRGSKAPTTLSLITAARTGMTRVLYEKAKASKSRTINMRGFIEGPYAGHDSLGSFGTVVMFAGGAGITHHLVQIRHLIASANARTVATRKIVLVWSVRDLAALTWVSPWMDEILKMPGRKGVLSMNLFVTKPRGPADYQSPSRSIRLTGGRCDPGKILDEVLCPSERVGAAMVSVCGPGAFADEVRSAVRERLHWGCIDMNEESFTW